MSREEFSEVPQRQRAISVLVFDMDYVDFFIFTFFCVQFFDAWNLVVHKFLPVFKEMILSEVIEKAFVTIDCTLSTFDLAVVCKTVQEVSLSYYLMLNQLRISR